MQRILKLKVKYEDELRRIPATEVRKVQDRLSATSFGLFVSILAIRL
jgi:hypothetical protein